MTAYIIPGMLSLDKEFNKLSKIFYLSVDEIKSKSRRRDIITARSVIYNYLYNEDTRTIETIKGRSLSRVGSIVSGLDHASVLNGIKTYNNLYETDKEFRRLADEFNVMVG